MRSGKLIALALAIAVRSESSSGLAAINCLIDPAQTAQGHTVGHTTSRRARWGEYGIGGSLPAETYLESCGLSVVLGAPSSLPRPYADATLFPTYPRQQTHESCSGP